jgi:excisionase family DNA binding protein
VSAGERADRDPLECLPADRVAGLLGISKSQVYALARQGKIPHVREGGSVLFPRRSLERWLDGASDVETAGRRARVDRLGAGRGSRGSARR